MKEEGDKPVVNRPCPGCIGFGFFFVGFTCFMGFGGGIPSALWKISSGPATACRSFSGLMGETEMLI